MARWGWLAWSLATAAEVAGKVPVGPTARPASRVTGEEA